MSSIIDEGDEPTKKHSFESLLSDVPLELSVELGRVTMTLREIAERLGPGSVIPLTKLTGEKLDVRINDRLIARGEAVAVGERYGVRIVELLGTKVGGQS
jgi:flagellar motor switch protein FliN/FliY